MRRGALIGVGAVLLLLALAWTAPLAKNLTGAIPYTILPQEGLENIPLYPGDHLQFYYRLWLFYDSLKAGHPFTPAGHEFNGNMGRPAVSGQFVPLSLVYALFAPLGGPLAYNLLLLLSFPLTGLFTYLLVRSYGGGFWGGLAGALTATFMPYRLGQLAGGHPNGFVFFAIPLLLWLLEEYLRTGRRLLAWLAGLTLFCQVFMELHAAFYTGLLMAVYLPLRWLLPAGRWIGCDPARSGPLPPPRQAWVPPAAAAAVGLFRVMILVLAGDGPSDWRVAAASGMVWGLAVLFFYAMGGALLGGIFGVGRRTAQGVLAPAFAPLLLLPLYGLRFLLPIPLLGRVLAVAAVAGSLFLAVRAVLALVRARPPSLDARGILRGRAHGLLPLALSMAGAGFWIMHLKSNLLSGSAVEKGRSAAETLLYTPLLGDALRRINPAVEFYLYPGAAALLVLAAGLVGKRRDAAGGDGWAFVFFGAVAAFSYLFCFGQRGDVIFPLHDLLRSVPFMTYGRVTSRAMILFTPAFSVLVGLGLHRLLDRRATSGAAALAGLLAAGGILFDYSAAASFGLTRLPERNLVYEEAARGGKGMVLEVPLWPGDSAWSSVYQYWVTRYGHRMVNGYSPVVSREYLQQVFQPLAGLNVGALGARDAELLRRMGVERLLLHEDVFPPQVSVYPYRLTLQALDASPWLRPRLHDGWVRSFDLLDRPRADAPPAGGLTSPLGIVLKGEAGPMNPATRELTANGWVASGSDPGRPVVRGPDRLFPAGEYRLRVRMGQSEHGPASARLRVSDRAGALIGETTWHWTEGDVPPAGVTYDFATASPLRLIFEIYPQGGRTIQVEYLYLLRAGQRDPPEVVEFEDLPHAGRIVGEAGAGGGAVVLLTSGQDPAMPFTVGPRRLLPPGEWRFTIRYRAGAAASPVARVSLREVDGPVLEELRLVGSPGAGWSEVSTAVSVARETFFTLEVFYSGSADLELDRLEVEPG